MHWIDIVVIAFLGIFALIGLWKGFFNGLFSLCSIFVSFLIAMNTANWFANLIRKLVDIDGWFDHFLSDTCNVGDSMVIFGASYPREKVAAFLTVLISGIIIFILLRCIIALLKKMFENITKNSATIGLLNRIFGAVLGVAKSGVLVVLVLGICSIITSLGIPKLSDGISSTLESTKFTNFVYGYVDKFVDGKMDGKSFNEIIDGVFNEDDANKQDDATSIEVIYASGKDYYEFVVGEEVDYSKIYISYKAGNESSSELYNPAKSSFSPAIDTSTASTNKTSTITMFGKTTTFKYIVVEA